MVKSEEEEISSQEEIMRENSDVVDEEIVEVIEENFESQQSAHIQTSEEKGNISNCSIAQDVHIIEQSQNQYRPLVSERIVKETIAEELRETFLSHPISQITKSVRPETRLS